MVGNSTPYPLGLAGGSGTVILQENYVDGTKAPGVWSMNTVYDFVKQGEWPKFLATYTADFMIFSWRWWLVVVVEFTEMVQVLVVGE